MERNWDETAVSAVPLYIIVYVVDWASESPLPVPIPNEISTPSSSSYSVYARSIHDPGVR